MSWGYWGILAGIVTLLAILFVCMEVLYAGARVAAKGNGPETDEGRDGSQAASSNAQSNAKHANAKHAA